MPSIICPSPQILDQAFPRNVDELYVISQALGKLVEIYGENRLRILLTPQFESVIDPEFIWAEQKNLDANQTSLLSEITRLLAQLYLQSSENIEYINTESTAKYIEHLLPKKCDGEIVSLLAHELGKILVLHDQCIEKDEFFIGIACPYGFSGGELDTYDNPTDQRVFPLVGLETFEKFLVDADEWIIPPDIAKKQPYIKHLTDKVLDILGASRIERGGRHNQVIFLDISVSFRDHGKQSDILKDYFFDDLIKAKVIQEKGYTQPVLKYILTEGKLPERRCKLERLKSKK